MLSTSSKIAFGYILLIGLLIGSIKYIYKQMTFLTERTELENQINDRRQTTHKIISKLYEIEIIGQTLHSGNSSEYRNFNRKMNEVQLSIDTLQTLLTDSMQCHRLDTLRALLKYKSDNMRAVTKALQRTPADVIYQQQFDSLLTQQDSLLNSSHVRKRIITHHNTYTIHHKPKGFFKRIADVFAPGKADSTEVSNVIQEEVIDTLEEAYNPIDTIAHMLTDIQSKVLETRQKELRNLDAHVKRLRIAGGDLSRRVNQLLETIEKEEQEAALQKIHQEQEIRSHAAWTMATISIIAVVLVLIFFGIIWHDLTKSTHYRKELEKAKLYAENLLVAREKLMLTITHDIKAPAGSIIGYIDLLNRLVKDKRQLFYLNNMQSAAQHLLNLVTSLLDFHRLEAGKMDLNPVSFKPYQLLEDIYHCFLPLAEKKSIHLQFHPHIASTLTLEGDPFRLRQIVENLLSNALKFTSQGEISLEADYQGNQFIIRVSDTGCGMTAEEQLRIFNEFTRLHSAQGQEGFGLGLSITRKLIDLQHGKISVHSVPNVGSTFEVSIPLPSYGNKEEDVPPTSAATTDVGGGMLSHQNEAPNIRSVQPLHILLIDDDPIQLQLNAALLHRALDTESLPASALPDIRCCEQPEEVLSLLQAERFDLLITDIQMPAMNGFELRDAIRNLPDQCGLKVPIVAITARGDMDEEAFRNKGFAGMLQKPFNQSDLKRVLTEVLKEKIQPTAPKSERDLEDGNKERFDALIEEIPEKPETNKNEETSSVDETDLPVNFTSLFAFSEGDPEAAREILSTFLTETEKNIGLIEEAQQAGDVQRICEIAHKMLPTFTMLEVKKAVKALQWLESLRKEPLPLDEARPSINIVIESARLVIRKAHQEYGV